MNAAQNILEEQINDETPVEARIAKLESDVEHIKNVMDDVKLGLQNTQTEIRAGLKAANDSIATLQKEVAGITASITATLPHLATKADLAKLEGSLDARIGKIEASLDARIEARIHAMEAKIIRWFIITAIAIGSLAFSIARFVNLPSMANANPAAQTTRLPPSDVSDSPIT